MKNIEDKWQESPLWLYVTIWVDHGSVSYAEWGAAMGKNGLMPSLEEFAQVEQEFEAARSEIHRNEIKSHIARIFPATDEEICKLAKALLELKCEEHPEWDGSDPSHENALITAVQADLLEAGFDFSSSETAHAIIGTYTDTQAANKPSLRELKAATESARLNLELTISEIEINGSNPSFRPHEQCARALQGMGYHLDAIMEFTNAITMAPYGRKSMLLYGRALSRHATDDLKMAITDLKLAMISNTQGADATNSRSLANILESEMKRFTHDLEHEANYRDHVWPANFARRHKNTEGEPHESNEQD